MADRFIPWRSTLKKDIIQHMFNSEDEEVTENIDILCQEVSPSSTSTYRKNLKNIFYPNAEQYSTILPLYVHKKDKRQPVRRKITHWPVRPRQSPCISNPEALLDLPNFCQHLGPEIIDWGNSNYIAASVCTSVILYHADTHEKLTVKEFSSSMITGIKFNPDGKRLACNSIRGPLELIDIHELKVVAASRLCCHKYCEVTALDFHPIQQSIALGCSEGTVTIYSKDLNCKSGCQLHRGHVLKIAFSCQGTYLASTGLDKQVFIVRANEVIFCMKTDGHCRGLAWHPWRESYLVLGDTKGKMQLHNVASGKTLARYHPEIEQMSSILCLMFSKVTGELITSHKIKNETHFVQQINVLESFDRVVDRINYHLEPIFYLKCNPDGTKLVTAGKSEEIQIWNFLPPTEKQRKSRCKEFNNKNETLQFWNRLSYVIR